MKTDGRVVSYAVDAPSAYEALVPRNSVLRDFFFNPTHISEMQAICVNFNNCSNHFDSGFAFTGTWYTNEELSSLIDAIHRTDLNFEVGKYVELHGADFGALSEYIDSNRELIPLSVFGKFENGGLMEFTVSVDVISAEGTRSGWALVLKKGSQAFTLQSVEQYEGL